MTGRYLIFVPEINPNTFVFFYSRGSSERSFSIRDYTTGSSPLLRYANEFPDDVTSEMILSWTNRPGNHRVKAEPRDTNDVAFWRRRIEHLNRSRLGLEPRADPEPPQVPTETESSAFPLLDLPLFQSLPKARKGHDVRRMFTSPRSEDWVTWNVFRLLSRRSPQAWWPHIMAVANSRLRKPLELPAPTRIDLWVPMNAPLAYEAASRARMATSDDPAWVARAALSDPVEGSSEIDVVMRGTGYLLIAEAKLTSDISSRTTYDPARNQIARNIDCVLESAGGDLPLFWMIVKDRASDRMYVQLIEEWQKDPTRLSQALPHRDVADIHGVLDRCATITWSEILEPIEPDSDDEPEVWDELIRRIS